MKKTFLNFFVLLFVLTLPGFALDLDKKEVLVRVGNVPVGTTSLFVPVTVSSNELDFYQIQLKDIFVKGYLASLEKDEKKQIVGISFAALQSRSLPENLEAIIKVRLASRKELALEKDEENTNSKKPRKSQYPKSVSINWNSPWIYTKPTKVLKEAIVGFNAIELSSNDSTDIDKKELKRKREQLEKREKDFYLKSFGQPIIRSQMNAKSKKTTDDFSLLSLLRQASFFVVVPNSANLERLYIPLLISEPDLLKIEVADTNLSQGAVIRILNNNLLEISSVNNLNLPSGAVLTGALTFKASNKSLLNKLGVGPVLSEPSEPVAGVGVSFTPASITIRNESFPINIFN